MATTADLVSSTSGSNLVSPPVPDVRVAPPSVVTSAPAVSELNQAKSTLDSVTKDISQQKSTVDAKATADAQAAAQAKLEQDKIAADKADKAGYAALAQTAGLIPSEIKSSIVNGVTTLTDASGNPLKSGGVYNYNGSQVQVDNDGKIRDIDSGAEVKIATEQTGVSGLGQTMDNIASLENAYNKYNETVTGIQNGTIPLTPEQQAQLDVTKAIFEQAKQAQKIANQNYTAGVTQAGVTRGLQRYSPKIAMGEVQDSINSGIQEITKIDAQMSQALSALRNSFRTENLKAAKDAYDTYNALVLAKNDQITKIATAAQEHLDKVQEQERQAKKDFYEQVTKPIQDIATELSKVGAPSSVIADVSKAKDVQEALNLAGDNLQTATGQLGDYLQYKRDKARKGLVPEDYASWKAKDDAAQIKMKANEAYAVAYAQAKAKAAVDSIVNSSPGAALTQDYTSVLNGRTPEQIKSFNSLNDADKSVVAQLISGNALLSDVVKGRGAQGTKDIQKYIQQATSIDPSFSVNTNKARYEFLKKWNDPSGKSGMTRNAINTALGHMADFKESADALDPSSIRKLNSVKNILETETGDPKVLKLRTDINALASEVAAVYKGGSPTEKEIQDWEQTIAANFSKAQFQGVSDEITKLLSSKISATRYQYKSVMGNEYAQSLIDPDKKQALIDAGINPEVISKENVPANSEASAADSKNTVDNFIKLNPKEAETVARLYTVPGTTDEDVVEYLKLNKKI